jgi:ABC-type Fe3+-siderophore transport system permease subunit
MTAVARDSAAGSYGPAARLAVLPALVVVVLAGAGLAAAGLTTHLPAGQWLPAALSPDDADVRQLLVHYSLLPRLAVAILAGAALGLSGALLQEVLANPLASPTTVGIEAGARLALAVATLFAPGLLGAGREAVALAGGAAAIMVVLGLAARARLHPEAVALAGLLVGLYAGSAAATLTLLNEQWLVSLFVWGGGSLVQQDWSAVAALGPRLVAAGLAAALVARPLAILGLGDEAARSLGLPVAGIRLAGIALAVFLATSVVSLVGVIAFVGLIAPALARLLGARTIAARLVAAATAGAALLTLTDLIAQQLSAYAGELLPTGALTAVLGAPTLFVLVARSRMPAAPPPEPMRTLAPAPRPWLRVALIGAALLGLLGVALLVGPGADGWHASLADAAGVLPWRWPRTLAAMTAGAMLAAAGTVLQRLTGNPMAAPEMVGASAGAAGGLIVAFLLLPGAGRLAVFAVAVTGAAAALAAVLALAGRGRLPPDRILLAGIALGALVDAVVAVVMAGGDPRAMALFAWSTGSTYRADAPVAVGVAAVAALLLAALPLTRRWLALLPLGAAAARALGLPLAAARLALLGLTAALTAAATLVVGPISFVGLMAPHLARGAGLRRPGTELAGAVAIGAAVMVGADWLGRTVVFPFEIPAGLAATLIGGPLLVALLAGRRR